jgi:hypothetical protein
MGDKSPKANNKQSAQKKVKSDGNDAKKKADTAAKQVVKTEVKGKK